MGGNFLAKSLPLQGWVTGKKSFAESLKTDGGGWEQRINRGILKAGESVFSPRQSSGYTPMTKGLPSNTQYFQQQQQMLQNMQAQQRANLANLRTQSPSYPVSNQTATTQVQATPPSVTAPTTATLAQTKISDTTMPSDLPMDFSYKPPTATPKIATANTFSLPNMSDIKFGGA